MLELPKQISIRFDHYAQRDTREYDLSKVSAQLRQDYIVK